MRNFQIKSFLFSGIVFLSAVSAMTGCKKENFSFSSEYGDKVKYVSNLNGIKLKAKPEENSEQVIFAPYASEVKVLEHKRETEKYEGKQGYWIRLAFSEKEGLAFSTDLSDEKQKTVLEFPGDYPRHWIIAHFTDGKYRLTEWCGKFEEIILEEKSGVLKFIHYKIDSSDVYTIKDRQNSAAGITLFGEVQDSALGTASSFEVLFNYDRRTGVGEWRFSDGGSWDTVEKSKIENYTIQKITDCR
ncbi:MAG TPA: hypothetical protein PKN56_22755 [Leptospiraceae bacterium]|nr:hypothetical protein [Leptospiraceae bacterium]HNN06392.1 hypothetical protein [Leptospiraceae bacterium]